MVALLQALKDNAAHPLMRVLESVLLSRSELATRAGLTFGGLRDTFAVLGFKKDLRAEDYRQRYERGDVAARIVEAFPNSTWRGTGGEILENDDVEITTAFEEAWMELATRLSVWSKFRRADVLAGLGRYSAILIGAPGNMNSPLTKASAEQIAFLRPYGEDQADIKSWDKNPASARFGQPEMYSLKSVAPDEKQVAKDVHWSRILHIADGLLDDEVYGQPRLKRSWNNLDNLDKLAGAGCEAFWLRAHQGFQFNIDKDLKPSPKEIEEMQRQVDEYVHGLRRAVRTRGMNIDTLGSDVADFANNMDAILTLLSAGQSIPKRILLGSERGELASTQDRENWTERVQDRRDAYAGPMVVRQFVDRLILLGALPTPEEYEVFWPPVNDFTDEQRLDVAIKYAEINAKAGETVVTANEIRDLALDLEPLDEEDLPDETEVEVEEDEEDVPVPRAAAVKSKKPLARKRYAIALSAVRSRMRKPQW
jgi:hypothetical protein